MNIKHSLKMLSFISILILTQFLILSCNSTPIIDGPNPFIVNQIDQLENNMCEYHGSRLSSFDGNNFTTKPSIVLPCGSYNIGDTITFKPKHHESKN